MEALQMLKFSLKRGIRLNFTAGTSHDDEVGFLESVTAANTATPDDIITYGRFLVEQGVIGIESDSESAVEKDEDDV
ncbi:hypothetical protein FA15DRAFT_604986 [Coprinopsis marcescibilis]|uniref:Uncharacterized protein n=1 Tax=Coprinopsis marcescibilis TaxID=230819 RepID=A0A5C3KCV9_COPMA|nr:hypothetical protein FA15DRAFT_604986 [Coprinopsis marcescibilis]